ncbi:MarR family winged helix-turn-helix transcriptional regulator [Kocuria sp.]|uniref:MarR family winged helix-turn-helix transcriptional regulator n=1 Tax=Kocuria sp. TaxID=1871328 RepID=UPI0026DD9EF4|nr:MarR family winged helix-turn-helix transcriptional regulator [Kocuria sp.]MDO4918943.1 MarR family winged helix-turn-helix transcriptional regulator [Kocuria sp.]
MTYAHEPRDSDRRTCDLGWALGMCLRGYRARVEPVFAEVPRGARGYQLLHTVAHKPIRTQMELAEYLGVDRTVMPYVVDDLVESGLVRRERDGADRRIRTVVVTDAGTSLLRSLEVELARAESELLSALDPQLQDVLRDALARVAQWSRDDRALDL